jgi:hypothetical protein
MVSDEQFIGRTVKFLIPPSYTMAKGKIIDTMANNRYLIQIISPQSLQDKWPNGIDVPEEDINSYDLMTPIGLTMIKIRAKKSITPKSKRCSCKKK